jgi:hypothetical protein
MPLILIVLGPTWNRTQGRSAPNLVANFSYEIS